jgi:signal transduction histidine kinase
VLSGLREIIINALAVSGAAILLLGLAAAALLSLAPLRRIDNLRAASRAALKGELGVRLPVSHRRDEIDMLAGLANAMMDETERLLWEVKSVGDNVAHDLRTPLNRLRALLYRVTQETKLEGCAARWSTRRSTRPTPCWSGSAPCPDRRDRAPRSSGLLRAGPSAERAGTRDRTARSLAEDNEIALECEIPGRADRSRPTRPCCSRRSATWSTTP